jgi:uncharacterized protein (TIGR02996 family)
MTLDARAEELLAAIAASHDDDAARLVFADHIADRWPAHAAWIVAQCSGNDSPELLAAFLDELPPCLRDQCRTQRGFFETWEWQLEARDFIALDPDVLYRLAPWCNAVALQAVEAIEEIAARMQRFEALAITASRIADPDALVSAPGLAHLRGLALRHMHIAPVFEALVRTTSFVALERLELGGRTDPGDLADRALRALGDAPFARTLRTLDVGGYQFRNLVETVARLPALRELDAVMSTIDARFATLSNRFTRLYADSCDIGDEAAVAIAASGVMSELEFLSALGNPWDAASCARFLSACGPLRELHCGVLGWHDAHVLGGAFGGMAARTSLEDLELTAELGPAGIRALAETDLPRLRHLALDDTTLRHGLLALVRAPFLRQLESLVIRPDGLSVSIAHALADALGEHTRLILMGPPDADARAALHERLGARLSG